MQEFYTYSNSPEVARLVRFQQGSNPLNAYRQIRRYNMSLEMHNGRLQLKADLQRQLEQAKQDNNKELIARLERDIERLEDIIKGY